MTKLRREDLKKIEKIVSESNLIIEGGIANWEHIEKKGCMTVAQCALLLLLRNNTGKIDVAEAGLTFWNIALMDAYTKKLVVLHPETLLPLSEYLRLAIVDKGGDNTVISPDWLVELGECELWLKTKGFILDLSELKSASAVFKATAASTTNGESKATDERSWQDQARLIADELFNTDTESGCRDSLKGYSRRVMDEMQKRRIHGPRGRITASTYIMREALQAGYWWANKQK